MVKVKALAQEMIKNRNNYYFILPMYLFMFFFLIFPTIQGVYLGFFDFTVGSERVFTGVNNYITLFDDRVFWIAMKNTFYLVLVVVPLCLIVALLISVTVLKTNQYLKSFVRAAFYLPLVVSAVALSITWRYIYDPAVGLANYVLGLLNIGPIIWLGDTRFAMLSVMLIIFTFALGKPIIIYLASLGGIPDTYYEAARIDGANAFRQFIHITLPMLKPTTLYLVITSTISVFQVFVFIKLLTTGGPNNSTQTLAYLLYEKAFVYGEFGVACVIGTILCLICVAIAIIEYKLLSSDIEY